MPRISLIMPFRNAEKWIGETILSILEQDFTDWELIAVDDHSTDGSASIIRHLSKKDERIRCYQNSGNGIIPALHTAFQTAQGEFISRIDADDLMPKQRLSRMIQSVPDSEDPFLITGKVRYFSNHKVSEGYRKYENWLNERITLQDHYVHVYRECVIASPNWLCRSLDLKRYNLLNDLSYPEDYHMVLKWYAHNFKVISIPEITLFWREHPERTSRNSSHYQQPAFFRLKLKHWAKHELHDNESVAVLGKGQKAKLCMKHLLESQILCKMYSETELPELNENKVLIAVYPEQEKRESLIRFLEQKNYILGRSAWFV